MNIVTAVFVVENPAIPRHEDGDRVRQKKHSGGHCAGKTVGARVTDTGVFQVHGVHEVM